LAYFPVGQRLHAEDEFVAATCSEYLPISHTAQKVLLVSFMYFPIGQSLHLLMSFAAASIEYFPAGQSLQYADELLAPVELEYVPAGQDAQRELPLALEYFPLSQ
jgi:hypothetical protein